MPDHALGHLNLGLALWHEWDEKGAIELKAIGGDDAGITSMETRRVVEKVALRVNRYVLLKIDLQISKLIEELSPTRKCNVELLSTVTLCPNVACIGQTNL